MLFFCSPDDFINQSHCHSICSSGDVKIGVAKPVPVPDDFDDESNLGESPPETGRPLLLDIDNEEREGRADISINDNIG